MPLGDAHILRANALALPLADASVDLIVTSPPYFGLRSYQDSGAHYDGQIGAEATPAEFLEALVAATREMARVLKPSGSIFVNLGDKYSQRTQVRRSSHQPGMHEGRHPEFAETWAERAAKGAVRMPHQNIVDPASGTYVPEKSLMGIPWRYAIKCVDDLGLILRSEIIWDKPNGNPERLQDRVRRSHETWFHFAKTRRIFSATGTLQSSTGRAAGSVWNIPVASGLPVPADLDVVHTAAFPIEWPKRFVAAWAPEGGVVLDPFGGSGTTALAAKALGRTGVSVDMSADYCRIAEWRVSDEAQIAKAQEPIRHRTSTREVTPC